MIISERSIGRENWEWSYKFVTRRSNEGWKRKVVRIDGHTVWMVQAMGLGYRSYYAIFEDTPRGERPIAWLMLKQRKGWMAWEVEQLWVFPKFRGLGLARKLYTAAINYDRLMVASGKSHTKHSKAMWESFVRRGRFNIWAHDFANLRRQGEVMWDDDEGLVSRLSLYRPRKKGVTITSNDVRLVALAKDIK